MAFRPPPSPRADGAWRPRRRRARRARARRRRRPGPPRPCAAPPTARSAASSAADRPDQAAAPGSDQAAAQHDLDRLVEQLEPVSATRAKATISSASRSTISRATASDSASARTIGATSTSRSVADPAEVDRLRELLGRLESEVGGDRCLEAGRLPAAVGPARRGRQSGRTNVVTSAPVSGDQPEGRESGLAPVGRDADAIDTGTADDGHPPPRSLPARSTPKVSLATVIRRAQRRADSASCNACSSAGRSAPASRTQPTSASAPSPVALPERRGPPRRTSRRGRRGSRRGRSGAASFGTADECQHLPSRLTRARCVFELPPSTAMPIGSLT